ncbi:MAG: Glucose/sorbosone dehydrogenase-like protein [Cypionkella sp.]|uniref:NAD(P)H-binding protein n=1 Tax=Cypionkella sp. TaxID=2811411 RepID=UPI002610C5D3|nr:NAD(P)H-binding protein [Cypionkella sp.]MDB5660022.1 Glucose/sorbosone dehydrogenase-like protein [Cypionkella sp.]
MSTQPPALRVFVLGATGTIGRATVAALSARGHEVVCLVRPGTNPLPCRASLRFGNVTDPASLARDGFRGESFDAIVSCLASRTGAPQDAWAIDHKTHLDVLAAGRRLSVRQMVLLSAICVQRPKLAFQHAKLAFEHALIDSGLIYSIVRPTAYFKSLSGQVNRLKAGKPFLLFGDGALTACKPISDDDLGSFLADCLENPALQNRILPIGGPGPAVTPRQQGEELFRLLDMPPKFRHVPVGVLDGIIAVLDGLGRISPKLKSKAELARIGRYYATESMLVFNAATGRYDADATPSIGSDTLFKHYARLACGEVADDRGAHAVF